jgi:hypothetical protein
VRGSDGGLSRDRDIVLLPLSCRGGGGGGGHSMLLIDGDVGGAARHGRQDGGGGWQRTLGLDQR